MPIDNAAWVEVARCVGVGGECGGTRNKHMRALYDLFTRNETTLVEYVRTVDPLVV